MQRIPQTYICEVDHLQGRGVGWVAVKGGLNQLPGSSQVWQALQPPACPSHPPSKALAGQ